MLSKDTAGDGTPDVAFLAGLGAFLAGHVCYAIAFLRTGVRGVDVLAGVLVALGVVGLALPRVLRGAAAASGRAFAAVVGGYAALLAVMTVLGVGTGSVATALGGALFLASDTCWPAALRAPVAPRRPGRDRHLPRGAVPDPDRPAARRSEYARRHAAPSPCDPSPTVVVPGWPGADPGHWQGWLAERLTCGRSRGPAAGVPRRRPPGPGAMAGPPCARPSPVCPTTVSTSSRTRSAPCCGCTTSPPGEPAPRPARVALVAPPRPHTAAGGYRRVLPAAAGRRRGAPRRRRHRADRRRRRPVPARTASPRPTGRR